MTDPTLARLADAAERIANALEVLTAAPRDPLAVALVEVFGAAAFTTADVMQEAARQAAEAAALGQAPPVLPAALEAAGVRSGRALARRLPALGAQRIGREGAGCLWCFQMHAKA